MTNWNFDDHDIRRYLLGHMTPPEHDHFEAAYFEDSQLMERMKLVEDQLINEHLLFKLSEEDQHRFAETYLAPPSRYQRVKLAETLLEEATHQLSSDPQFCDAIGYQHPLEPSDVGQPNHHPEKEFGTG